MLTSLVTGADRARQPALFGAMFDQRRRVFVEMMGWRGLSSADGGEVDEFDLPSARYLVVLDEAGVLQASLRLLPTDGPNLMATLFADWVDGPLPCAANVVEWSRYVPGDPRSPVEVVARSRRALHLAALAYARAEGVVAYTGLLETRKLAGARALGWPARPLGPPRAFPEGEAIAVINPIAEVGRDALGPQEQRS